MYNDGVQLNLTSATVTQSSNYGTRVGANVVKATNNYANGNSEDTWTSATGSAVPQWIVIDAGAPITADLMMYYYGGDTSSFNHRAPYAYQFQKSTDGSTWVDVVVESAGPASNNEQYKPFI